MNESRLMLGTVQFGLKYGINNTTGKPPLDSVMKILQIAANNGINVLDTARNYGDSEEVLGLALEKTGLQKHFKIISKVQHFPENLHPDNVADWIENSVKTSLKMLKRECLDGLLLHDEKDLPHFSALEMCVKQGWTQEIGASLESLNGSSADLRSQLRMAQVPGNIIDHRFFATARDIHQRGGSVFMRSVYMQGLLFKDPQQVHPALSEILIVRNNLEKLASETGISPAELYFRYLLSLPEVDCVLTGVDTPEQLTENIRIAKRGALPEELMRTIDALIPSLPEKILRPGCWPK